MAIKKILGIVSFGLLLSVSYTANADNNESYSQYCTKASGVVEEMPAIFSTQAGQVIGESRSFCNFSVDDGFISIGLETFASEKPSIAATYMKKLAEITANSPLWKGESSNPAHNVCKNLGGAAIGFVTSGGFTDQLGESDICVFGDGSMVSGWSLIYMANHRTGYDNIKNQVKAEPLSIRLPSEE